jgi:hypothetical protein
MLRFAVEAEDAARTSGDASLRCAGAGVLALAAYSNGDIPLAQAQCERAETLAAELDDGALAGRVEPSRRTSRRSTASSRCAAAARSPWRSRRDRVPAV